MPLTEDALGRLTDEERSAYLAVAWSAASDLRPGLEATAILLLTIERLLTQDEQDDPAALVSVGTGPAMDQRCHDGKHGDCPGAGCQCPCGHERGSDDRPES